MYIRVTATPNSPRKSVKVVESVRQGLKVKQVMIHHVGVACDEQEIEKLKQLGKIFIVKEQLRRDKAAGQLSLLEAESLKTRLVQLEQQTNKKRGRKPALRLETVTAEDRISLIELVEERRVVEGVHEVAGHVYDNMGYHDLVKGKKNQMMLKDLVLMRLAQPTSKLKTQQLLDKNFSKTYDIDAIYRLMDTLYPRIDEIKNKTFIKAQHILPEAMDILFFDCTTLYFESTDTDELRQFGYSKDHRFNTTQVVLALATNPDGLPLGYELFQGNQAEVKTLLQCLERWKNIFKLNTVCFVADRAMMSEENIKLLETQGHHYIIAAKLRSLPDALKNLILDEAHYQPIQLGNDLGWVGEFDYKERRLLVSYKTARARRDAQQRQQVLDKIIKRVGDKADIKKFVTNQGVKKYTRSEQAQVMLDPIKIEQDQAWDGLHGVITNIREQNSAAIIARYAQLWRIEESFRINKHTLSMRPIYHYKPERIKTHIAICYMAFAVLRHMEYQVKLTQKISLEVLLDELMRVQASFYRHLPTGKLYRMPGRFSHNAAKIYKAFQLQRCNQAQVALPN